MPLRSKAIRGKTYSLLVLQSESNFNKPVCKELPLTVNMKYVDIIFIKDSEKPCSRSMWRSFYCVIKDKNLSFYNLYQLIDKEKYMKPTELTVMSTGMSLKEFDATILKFTKKEKAKLRGCVIHHVAISSPMYEYMEESK